jgi:hypothetical protein
METGATALIASDFRKKADSRNNPILRPKQGGSD